MKLNRLVRAILLTSLTLLLCSAFSVAQAAPKYDPATEAKFKGTIEDLKLPPKGSEKQIAYLTIKSGTDTLEIYLCPKSFIDDMGVIFAKGDEVMSGLTEFAERNKITAGHFTAIGALQSARFGWFDSARKAFRDIPINQQVELISLIGDVGLVNGAPQIHAHGAVGLPDGEVRGGHLLQAIAWPTLEVFFTAHPTTLIKKHDEETDLSLFDLKT